MTDSRAVILVQARMGSKRFPGKVLEDMCGKPVLAWVVDRAKRVPEAEELLVATSTDREDDPIANLCSARNYRVYRGHPTDVLDRLVRAARDVEAGMVVRITGDCPFIDPDLIGEAIREFRAAVPPVSLVLNRLPWERTFPIGLDVEVCSIAALETAHAEARLPHEREHVMPFLYEHPERFPFLLLRSGGDYGGLRWTLDEVADLGLLREVCSRFPGREDFSWREVLAVFEHEPALREWNAAVRHRGHLDTEA